MMPQAASASFPPAFCSISTSPSPSQTAAPANTSPFYTDASATSLAADPALNSMTTSAVSACQSSTKTHAKAVTACSSTLSSAVPALPPSTAASAVSILPSETQESSASKVNQTPEIKRAIKLLFNKANRLTENNTMHDKIAYSGCQGAIEDAFWKTVKKDPMIFIIEDKNMDKGYLRYL